MWRDVQSGGMCKVEGCAKWRGVPGYQCFLHATLGLSEESKVSGWCQTLKVRLCSVEVVKLFHWCEQAMELADAR